MNTNPYPAGFAMLDSVLGLQRGGTNPVTVWVARYFPDTGTWHAGNSVVPDTNRCAYRLAGFYCGGGAYDLRLSFEYYAERRYNFVDKRSWDDVHEDALIPLLYEIIDTLTNSPEETTK